MSSFSPSDAAFEGFRLTRERPRAIISWAICYLVFTYLIGLVADLALGSQSQALLADLQRASADPAAFWPAARKMAPFFLAGLPLFFAFWAIFTCAIYRAVLRPQDARRGYLRLGLDELRMMALNLIMGVVWGATIFGVLLVALLAAAAAATGGGTGMVFFGDVVTVIVFSAAIVVLVRLSMAGPMTFAEQRLSVFRSWSLTKGSFWRLFGAYALAFALGGVVLLLMLLVLGAVFNVLMQVAGVSITALSGMQVAGVSIRASSAAASNPLAILLAVLSQAATVLVLTCFYVVLKAPAAEIYKGLADDGAVAHHFD